MHKMSLYGEAVTDVADQQPPQTIERGLPVLEVENVTKAYGSGDKATTILQGLNLEVRRGELVCIVGPSGVGKTTLLKSLAGLHQVTSGEVRVDGRVIEGPPEELALVFQDYNRSLMPWLTVKGNVQMPLRHRKLGRREMERRCLEALEAVGLSGAAKKYPWQLSGGMQQRVSIARALAYQPEILVMDEPFASVDAQTRFSLEDLTLKLRDEFNMTILVVTHDIDEAVYLSDRIVVLGGKPAHVIETMDIQLPAPRDQIATRALKDFAVQRTRVMELIKAATP
jgi:NitT/TauT family transport system ATP-binding protein